MYNEINAHIIQRQNLIKARITSGFGELDPNKIEKAKGEGSKGGKIIGHTKSGKAVYEKHNADHKEYKEFKVADHIDAAGIHRKEKEKTSVEDHEHLFHGDRRESHMDAARKKRTAEVKDSMKKRGEDE